MTSPVLAVTDPICSAKHFPSAVFTAQCCPFFGRAAFASPNNSSRTVTVTIVSGEKPPVINIGFDNTSSCVQG